MTGEDKNCIHSLNSIGIFLLLLFRTFTGYSQEIHDSVLDADGNVYTTIKIGEQIWMNENLKTTRYNDNSEITLISDGTAWNGIKTSAFCWYNNDTINKSVYGALYNWHAVNTGKLCPSGWHVPAKDDWTKLIVYVNENGGKLKETGINPWYNPNVGATNESGFSARFGGFRSSEGKYYGLKKAGFWWSSTECLECDIYPEWNFNDAIVFSLGTKSSGYGIEHNNKSYGYSIRCLKNK